MSNVDELPAHGTTARAVGRPASGIKGCPCRKCRDAHNAYKKRRRVLIASGRHLTVDAAPATEHIQMLLAAGTGWAQIAAATGMSTSSVYTLAVGTQKRIRRARFDQVMALRPNPSPKTSTGSLGTVRRVRALIAAGHSVTAIAATAVLDIGMVSDLAAGKLGSVRHETAAKISGAYDRLSSTQGTSVRSINRGRREGWPTPIEWAGDIDDPDVDPATWARNDSGRRAATELAEDAEFIIRTTGVGLDLVAERLGIQRNTLDKARERTAARHRNATEIMMPAGGAR